MFDEPIVMDSRSSQPLYMQIKEALKQRILDGDFNVHERLPSESELMKMFGVSRITVRQALRDLHGDGLVFSVQGKGTFVSKKKAVQDVQHLQGFGEAMSTQGYETSTRVINSGFIRPDQMVSDELKITRTQQVLEVQRIRYLNREPICVDKSYFPEDIGKKLLNRDLAQDIFPMLENELDTPLGYADLKIEAIAADDISASLLNVKIGQPCLRIHRMVYTPDDRPIDFEYLTYRGDTFQYQLRVHRNN